MSDEFASVQWDRSETEELANNVADPIEEQPEMAEETNQQESQSEQEELPSREINYYISSNVCEPERESDGQNYFISYLIRTESDCPSFKTKSFQVRRRYSDFSFLYQCLSNDFPTCIIPPLPNKQRLEYLKGDNRFGEHFTTKRAISLNTFLSRISSHKVLKKAKIYHVFLNDTEYWKTFRTNLKIVSNAHLNETETLSDYLMNAFKKPHFESSNSKEIHDILDKSVKLQENVSKIDKTFGKVLKKQADLSKDFESFHQEFENLNDLMGNEPSLKTFSDNIHEMSVKTSHLNSDVDFHFLSCLKDLEHYIDQLKSMIKLKDTKLIDYEMLTKYLKQANVERQNLINGTSGTEGAMSFLSKKIESLSSGGSSSGNSTNDKVAKLDDKIEKLNKEVEESFKVFQSFETDLINEYGILDNIKNKELQTNLAMLGKFYSSYYRDLVKVWQDAPNADECKSTPSRVKDELFENDEILKNKEEIERE